MLAVTGVEVLTVSIPPENTDSFPDDAPASNSKAPPVSEHSLLPAKVSLLHTIQNSCCLANHPLFFSQGKEKMCSLWKRVYMPLPRSTEITGSVT